MSSINTKELIDVQDAIKAIMDGIEIEYAMFYWTGTEIDILIGWLSMNKEVELNGIDGFLNAKQNIYRIKPKQTTFRINGRILACPFKPKVGDVGYVLSDKSNNGYEEITVHNENFKIVFGMWSKLDDIKAVVEAIRSQITFLEE